MPSIGKFEALTRLGFAARGLMYIMVGWLALAAGREKDPAGVMSILLEGIGRPVLALMAAGFVAYAIWRLSEALIDSEGHGTDAKGIAVRLGGAVSGLVHLGLGLYAASLAIGASGRGGNGTAPEEGAATTLSLPGGWLLLAVAAAALIATGFYQFAKAVRGDFLRYLDQEAARRPWVGWIGRAGYAARGLVFVVMGWFLWKAAMETRAANAGGIDDALASLPEGVELVVAIGLLLFGLFSLVEARYRRINDPAVLERLRRRGMAPGEGGRGA